MKPKKLNTGDTIGVISPSFPSLPSFRMYYEKGIKELENMGFKVKEGKTNSLKRWWSGGTPKERAEDIINMFTDTSVKAVIAQNGGHGAIRILEYLDFDLIKNNPKPLIGMSDTTNLNIPIHTKTGNLGFHMDLVTYGLGWQWQEIKPDKKEYVRKLFSDALTSRQPLGVLMPLTAWECWREGVTEGRLFGGSLTLLCSLIGTPYFPGLEYFNDVIFFFEADDIPAYRIERCLTQLKYAGIFKLIKGLIIGKIAGLKKLPFREIEEPSVKELVLDICTEFNFPILAECDFGHLTPNLPMIIGARVKLDSGHLKLEYLESFVE